VLQRSDNLAQVAHEAVHISHFITRDYELALISSSGEAHRHRPKPRHVTRNALPFARRSRNFAAISVVRVSTSKAMATGSPLADNLPSGLKASIPIPVTAEG